MQAESEKIAADKLFGILPGDQRKALGEVWDEFEAAKTPDARFARAIDRLQPIILNYLVGGGTWLDYKVDVDRERALTNKIRDGAPALWEVAESVFADAVRCGWLREPSSAARRERGEPLSND